MVSDDLRNLIEASGYSAYQLGKAVGTNPQTIRLYLRGEVGLSQEISDRIGDLLGLAIVKRGDSAPEVEPPNIEKEVQERAEQMFLTYLNRLAVTTVDDFRRGHCSGPIVTDGHSIPPSKSRK